MGTNAKVGFHATYVETNGNKLESGVGNAIVGSYLNSLNLSDTAIVFATSAPPDHVQFLTKDNHDEAGISVRLFDDTSGGGEKASDSPNSDIYRNVGDWTIAIDPSLGNGCFALGGYKDGLSLRFGFDARKSLSLYIIIFRDSWKSIKPGSEYEVGFQLDSDTRWSGKFHGIDVGGSKGLYIAVPVDDFLKDLSVAKTFHVSYNGAVIDSGNLPRVTDAISTVRECQSKQGVPSDPFAS